MANLFDDIDLGLPATTPSKSNLFDDFDLGLPKVSKGTFDNVTSGVKSTAETAEEKRYFDEVEARDRARDAGDSDTSTLFIPRSEREQMAADAERAAAQNTFLENTRQGIRSSVGRGVGGLTGIAGALGQSDDTMALAKDLVDYGNRSGVTAAGNGGFVGGALGALTGSFLGEPMASGMTELDEGRSLSDAQMANLKGSAINAAGVGMGLPFGGRTGLAGIAARAGVQVPGSVGLQIADNLYEARKARERGQVGPEWNDNLGEAIGMGAFGSLFHNAKRPNDPLENTLRRAEAEGADTFEAGFKAMEAADEAFRVADDIPPKDATKIDLPKVGPEDGPPTPAKMDAPSAKDAEQPAPEVKQDTTEPSLSRPVEETVAVPEEVHPARTDETVTQQEPPTLDPTVREKPRVRFDEEQGKYVLVEAEPITKPVDAVSDPLPDKNLFDEEMAEFTEPVRIPDAKAPQAEAPAVKESSAPETAAKTEPEAIPEPSPRKATEPESSIAQPEPGEYQKPQNSTGTKNAITDAERAAEGRDPIIREAAKGNEQTFAEARAEIESNPMALEEVLARAGQGDGRSVSAKDRAILLNEKVRLRNERNALADKLNDPNLSDDVRASTQSRWRELESKINDIDQAAVSSGTEWGRAGQISQRMMREDYSLESMERTARASKGKPLTQEEVAAVKKDHENVTKALDEVESVRAAVDKATIDDGVVKVYSSLVKQIMQDMQGMKKERGRDKVLARMKAAADESAEFFKKSLSTSNSGLNPEALYHLTRIGAYHVARGIVKAADFVEAMRKSLGARFDEFKGAIDEVRETAIEMHRVGADAPSSGKKESPKAIDAENVTHKDVYDLVSYVLGKKESPKAIDAENVTHKDVYDLARRFVNEGVKGPDAVMKAVHGELGKLGSELSERDVRRLFTEYGKTISPSKEADKTALREMRQIVRLQESIDRLNEGGTPLKTGRLSDKVTQAIRDKRAELGELLKKHADRLGVDPDRLATIQDARATNLRHQIEDLERQIKTGERKVEKKPPSPDNDAVKELRGRRQELKKELADLESQTPMTLDEHNAAAQRRVNELRRQVSALEDRLANGKPEKPSPKHRPDNEVTRELEAKREELKAAINEAENGPPKTPEERYQDRRGKSLAKQLEEIQDRIKRGDYATAPRIPKELNEANQRAQFELNEAKAEFHRNRLRMELENAGKWEQAKDAVFNTVGLVKAIHTSLDVGAFGKQAFMFTVGHPIRATKMLITSIAAARSDKAAFKAEQDLKARPSYQKGWYKEGGLAITERTDPLKRAEEEFSTRYLDKLKFEDDPTATAALRITKSALNKIPGAVRASNRFHHTFLNLVRADMFDGMVSAWAKDPMKPTKSELTSIADLSNDFTGRGKFGNNRNTDNMQGMSLVLWSPRLYASRINTLIGRAFWKSLGDGDKKVAAGIASEYARSLAGIVTLMAVGYMFKAKDDKTPVVELDPRSNDFGRLQFNAPSGPILVDTNGGMAQYITLAARLATGQTKRGDGKVVDLKYGDARGGGTSRGEVVGRFVRNRYQPILGTAWSAMEGKDPSGKTVTPQEALIDLLWPITTSQFRDAFKETGDMQFSIKMTVLDAMGFSTMHKTNKKDDKKNKPSPPKKTPPNTTNA